MSGDGPVFELLRYDSFLSVWYWVLLVVLWSLVCHRTMGVPRDMMLRAARDPEVQARLETLARLTAERRAGIADAAGVPLAAMGGFGLAVLAGIGYGAGVEVARAAFVLLFPLAIAALRDVRLARAIRAGRLGPVSLRRRLMRRQLSTQGLAVLALIAAAVSALGVVPTRWY